MKKILAMLVVVMLVAACTVSAFAYSITTNFSDNDNFNGKPVEECTLTGDWYSDKFATSWKNGTEWSAFIDAMNDEGATLMITCDGNVTKLGFQSDIDNVQVDVETVDGVVTIAAADVMDACATALDGFGWCNFIISGDAGTVITAIEVVNSVVTDEEAPADDNAEVETTPADETTENAETAEETTPAETGIALAVVPMMVAAAAVVASKRR